jgi:hypothetical protein
MLAFLMFVVVIGTSVWVGFDAGNRDWSEDSFANKPWKWVLGSLLFWIIVFPIYLVKRGRVPAKGEGLTQQSGNLDHLPRPSAPPANAVAVPLAPAGWYPDPHRAAPLRYWSGNAWTEHTSAGAPQPTTVTESIAAHSLRPPGAPSQSHG